MSLEDGKAYNERLMPLARGDAQPDRKYIVLLEIDSFAGERPSFSGPGK